MDMTAEDDFLGFYDQKLHTKMCPILGGLELLPLDT
jgi:hypothetical protein